MTLLELIESIDEPDFIALVETQNYPAIAEYLNTPITAMIDNPEPQGEVPIPLSVGAFRSALSRSEKAALINLPTMAQYLSGAYANESVTEANVDIVANYFEEQVTGELTFLAAVRQLVEAGRRDILGALVAIMAEQGQLSAETAASLSMAMSTTELDPGWTAQIEQATPSPAKTAALGRVTDIQVQEALN